MTGRFSVFAALFFVPIAAGCSSSHMEKDFLCEAQTGLPCTTISAVDGTDATGAQSIAERPEDTAVKSLNQNPLWAGKGGAAGLRDGGFPYNAAAYRRPEVVGTLWIAPILDDGGLLHEARFVHFVIQEGKWRQ
ncbi:TraV family lipoprotein [uncultured Tateyamaria sp.]|uniref:TraV family lipoprotein n=1 Tax=uncultured Tateyamaria sp. TaxID=455651 RepID=UPI0026047CD6|nr:TraV family lipoprotein [uncultured Tateyamaria sp.]